MNALRDVFMAYVARWPQERAVAERFITLVETHPDALLRACVPGHLTGAALVVPPTLDAVLLTHHRKLGIWIQLGGHADGEPHMPTVAMKEAREESGLSHLQFLSVPMVEDAALGILPFDLDVHAIPARPGEPAHLHYDVRYLIVADRAAPVIVSEESHDVRWFTLEEARRLTDEPSMRRQFDKLDAVRAKIAASGQPC